VREFPVAFLSSLSPKLDPQFFRSGHLLEREMPVNNRRTGPIRMATFDTMPSMIAAPSSVPGSDPSGLVMAEDQPGSLTGYSRY
jgi:hypothetical protein